MANRATVARPWSTCWPNTAATACRWWATTCPTTCRCSWNFCRSRSPAEAERLLGDAIHVLAYIGRKLRANGSSYACVFDLLQTLTPVQAEELSEPPIRDMDEALETFGPGADGIEPLLKPGGLAGAGLAGTHPVNFYPKAAAPHH